MALKLHAPSQAATLTAADWRYGGRACTEHAKLDLPHFLSQLVFFLKEKTYFNFVCTGTRTLEGRCSLSQKSVSDALELEYCKLPNMDAGNRI